MADSEDITNLALRRNFFYPAAEIYSNAPSGFWEFGPSGEAMRRKLVEFWRKEFVQKEGFAEIFGSQILPEAVFKASGHLQNFNDPIAQCKKCKSLHRADQLIAEKISEIVPESLSIEELSKLIKKHEVQCPKCKGKDFTETKKFNMMMKVEIGATGESTCYLRPETCQSIFLDFARLYKTGRQQELPFGIAQAGNSFRNEISPRNTLLRAREFGQMEVEIFFNPSNANEFEKFKEVESTELPIMLSEKAGVQKITAKQACEKKIIGSRMIAYYLAKWQLFWEKIGIPKEKMRFRKLADDEKAFYAAEAFDFEVLTSLGWVELTACNNRTDYDLKGHEKESRKDLKVKEEGGKEAIIPHVFELSNGIDRSLWALLDLAFRKEKRGPEERIYLDLNPRIAPVFAGVFPLVKKDGLLEKALEVFEELESFGFDAEFDEKGSIGKRYARIDEIGCPFAITIDYDTLKDNTVTLRDRNSLGQKRIKAEKLPELLWKLQAGKLDFAGVGEK
ncbi:MAG TPA: glycine--tRNA ligase [Candidatus Diapherotrites archaeon]|uniref:glycine--tRNA ligase n=1 Tax=Candidatus Iainarchaeum sp. TaxID=3101447 RepID=A0A7J4KWU4_9ARCH|nr:glycine--tRNA ligase [Candidatus Diapherotrites archaeon]